MGYGGTMKGSRLKDVLDDKPFNKEYWDRVFGKLKKLGTAIEMYYGPHMDIDNVEYRWVQDRIKELQLLIEHWRKQDETNSESN